MPNPFLKYLSGLASLVFPQVCRGCGESVEINRAVLCRKCEAELPRTYFEKVPGNPVEQMFWGRCQLQFATSLFFYRKGELLQDIIHQLKYKGHKHSGFYLGQQAGRILLREGMTNRFDIVVPVPLHARKEKNRGYNQSRIIAEGLEDITSIRVAGDAVIRTVYSDSQTRKGRYERWQNVEGIFKVLHKDVFRNKHLLILDDVVTTGATIEALCMAFSDIENIQLSVLTIGIAAG